MKKRLFLFLSCILCANHCANTDPTLLDTLQKALSAVVAPPYYCLDTHKCKFTAPDLPTLHEHLRTKHANACSKCCEKCNSFFIFSSMHAKECPIFSQIPPTARKNVISIYYRSALRSEPYKDAKTVKLSEGEKFVKVLEQTEASVPPPK